MSSFISDIANVVRSMNTVSVVTFWYSVSLAFVGIVNIVYNVLTKKALHKSLLMIALLVASITTIWIDDALGLFYALEALGILGFVLISVSETKNIARVGLRYLFWHIGAGLLLLTFVIYQKFVIGVDSFYDFSSFVASGSNSSPWGSLVFFPIFGLLILTGIFPFFTWFVRVYAKLDSSSILPLSVIIPKTAAFVLLKVFYYSASFGHDVFPVEVILVLFVCSVTAFMFFIIVSRKIFDTLLFLSLTSISFAVFFISLIDDTHRNIVLIASYITHNTISLILMYLIYGYIVKYSSALVESRVKNLPHLLRSSLIQTHYSKQFFLIMLIAACFVAGLPTSYVDSAKGGILASIKELHSSNIFFIIAIYIAEHSQVILIIGVVKLISPFCTVRSKKFVATELFVDRGQSTQEAGLPNKESRIRQELYMLFLCWFIVGVLVAINVVMPMIHGHSGLGFKVIAISVVKFVLYGAIASALLNVNLSRFTTSAPIDSKGIVHIYAIRAFNLLMIARDFVYSVTKVFITALSSVVSSFTKALNDTVSYNLTLDKTMLLSFVLISFIFIT